MSAFREGYLAQLEEAEIWEGFWRVTAWGVGLGVGEDTGPPLSPFPIIRHWVGPLSVSSHLPKLSERSGGGAQEPRKRVCWT